MSYAVLWSEEGGPVCVGRLELEGDALRLLGAAPGGVGVRIEVALSQLKRLRIARERNERILGRPVLLLGRLGGRRLRVACLEGSGALLEIADRIGWRARWTA